MTKLDDFENQVKLREPQESKDSKKFKISQKILYQIRGPWIISFFGTLGVYFGMWGALFDYDQPGKEFVAWGLFFPLCLISTFATIYSIFPLSIYIDYESQELVKRFIRKETRLKLNDIDTIVVSEYDPEIDVDKSIMVKSENRKQLMKLFRRSALSKSKTVDQINKVAENLKSNLNVPIIVSKSIDRDFRGYKHQ